MKNLKDVLDKFKATGRPIVEIDLGDPIGTLDNIREAKLPVEALMEIGKSLMDVHTNLHLIGRGVALMVERLGKAAEAAATATPPADGTQPVAGGELRDISEADLARMKPVSEGN